MVRWPFCGPKLSLCCSIISVWGIVQFLLMGIFFFSQSVPLLDDFNFDHDTQNDDVFRSRLRNAYTQRAYNCWIAAFLYIGLLVFAGSQFLTNKKRFSGSNTQTATTFAFTGIGSEENGFNQQYSMHFNEEQHN